MITYYFYLYKDLKFKKKQHDNGKNLIVCCNNSGSRKRMGWHMDVLCIKGHLWKSTLRDWAGKKLEGGTMRSHVAK